MGFWVDFIWSWSITVLLFTVLTTFVATLWWYYAKDEVKIASKKTTAKYEEDDPLEDLEDGVLKDIRDAVLHETSRHGYYSTEAIHNKASLKATEDAWNPNETSSLKYMLARLEAKERSTFAKLTESMSDYLKEHNSQSINLSEIFSFHTLNILYFTALGKSFNIDDDQLVKTKKEVDATLKVWPDFSTGDRPTDPNTDEYKHAKEEFWNRMNEEVEQAHKNVHNDDIGIVDQLITFQIDNETPDYMFIYFMYGYPTMTKFFNSAALLLAEHPDVQENIFKSLGDDILFEGSTFIEKYPFIQATLQEILRITQIVPFAARCTVTPKIDDETENDYSLYKIDLTRVLANDQYWKSPEKFDPSRFLDEDGKFVQHKAYIPFSIGERTCPGKQLVNFTGRMFLTFMVKNFRLSKGEPSQNGEEQNVDPSVLLEVREQEGN